MHSCWCILLFECGLNSNSYLKSNFVGIRNGREKEIEEERKPKPQPNPTAQAHSSLSLPAGPLRPSSRRGPNFTSAWPAFHSGPARSPAAQHARPSPAPALARPSTLAVAVPRRPATKPAPRPCQLGPACRRPSPADRAPRSPDPVSLTALAHLPDLSSSSRNARPRSPARFRRPSITGAHAQVGRRPTNRGPSLPLHPSTPAATPKP